MESTVSILAVKVIICSVFLKPGAEILVVKVRLESIVGDEISCIQGVRSLHLLG